MKKCSSVTVIYNFDPIAKKLFVEDVTAYHKDNKILVSYSFYADTFRDMQDSVLKALKNNNLTVGKYEDFNAIWYNIYYIDTNSPSPEKYGYVK